MTDNVAFAKNLGDSSDVPHNITNGDLENGYQVINVPTIRQEPSQRAHKSSSIQLTPTRLFLLVCFQIVICVIAAVAVYFLTGIRSTAENDFLHLSPNSKVVQQRELTDNGTTSHGMGPPTTEVSTQASFTDGYYEDCNEVCSDLKAGRLQSYDVGFATQGTNATIFPEVLKGESIQVYCQCSIDGAWMVFQRRIDGTVDFNRTWAEYKNGFGDLKGEFWLGLEVLHKLTLDQPAILRVDLKNWKSETAFAMYSSFTISREVLGYYMVTDGYEGTAGDSISSHNGIAFDTYDRLNGRNGPYGCASQFGGGWWYTNCASSTLNGEYGQDLFWLSWAAGHPIIEAEMKIKTA